MSNQFDTSNPDANMLATLQRLDAERIERANAVLADSLDALDTLGHGFAALPRDMALHDLEMHLPHRRRLRGEFATSTIEAFASYVTHRADDLQPQVFVSSTALEAVAVFNIGDLENPGHADDRAYLRLLPTAESVAIQDAHGSTYTQAEFIDWAVDWSHCINFKRDGEPVPWAQALGALRNLTINRAKKSQFVEQVKLRETGSLERIEVEDSERLPDGFVFMHEPAPGLPLASLLVRLTLLPADDDNPKKPFVRLRIVGRESALEYVRNQFAHEIRAALPEARVLIGTYKA